MCWNITLNTNLKETFQFVSLHVLPIKNGFGNFVILCPVIMNYFIDLIGVKLISVCHVSVIYPNWMNWDIEGILGQINLPRCNNHKCYKGYKKHL